MSTFAAYENPVQRVINLSAPLAGTNVGTAKTGFTMVTGCYFWGFNTDPSRSIFPAECANVVRSSVTPISLIYGLASSNDNNSVVNQTVHYTPPGSTPEGVLQAVWNAMGYNYAPNNDAELDLNCNVSSSDPDSAFCFASQPQNLETLDCSGNGSHNLTSHALINKVGNGHDDTVFLWNEDLWEFMFTDYTTVATSIAVTSVSPSAEDYGSTAPVTIAAVLSWTGSGAAPTGSDVTMGGTGLSGSFGTAMCSAPSGDAMNCSATYTSSGNDAPGSYTLSASFSGDTNYSGSSSTQSNNFSINQATAATVVTTSGSPSTYGQSVTFTATISGENGLIKGRSGARARKRAHDERPLDVTGTVAWSANTGCGTTAVTSANPGIATCTTSGLAEGTDTITATYSGDSNHSGSSGSVNQVVNPASQAITFTLSAPSSATYNTSFNVAATGGASGNAVTFTAGGVCSITSGGSNTATYTMNSGTGTCSVIANQAASANYSAAPQVTQTVTANQAATTVVWPNPAPITYGTPLSATQLDATASVAGTFVYSPAAGTVLAAGTQTLSVTFTPTNTTDYATATGTVSLTVNKGTPTITWATPAAITYGTALSGTQLDATASVAGTFVYSPAAGTVLAAGAQTLSVTFTPTNTTDYATATGTVSLTVNKAPLTVTAQNASRVYGAANPTFSDTITGLVNGDTQSVVSGTASLTTTATTSSAPGTYPITPVPGTLSAANYTFSTFVNGTLAITKATPTITWATPAAITYPTALSATQLDATASVAGKFVYSPAAGTVLAAGTQTLNVTFTPTNTTDYATATDTVSLTVNQATPTIKWATPAAITYGKALTGTQLDATTSVAGTFVYSPTAGTVLAAGTQTLSATFTPTNTTDYTTATGTVSVTVNQAPLTVTAQNASRVYGAANPTFSDTITGFVNGDTQSVVSGTASLTTTATTSSAPGTYPITAALGTLSALNYTFSTFVNGTLTITRATPTITWATPAAITYGTALSGTQLDATASVAGTFVYSPAAGRVLAAGTQTLSVTFTPTNTTDYISVTDTVTLVVNEVGTTTTITSNLPNPSTTGKAVVVKFTVAQAMRYSVPTGGVTVNASTGESCTATLASGSGSCSVTFNSAGSRTLTATYAGDNNNNPSVSAAVTQTVN